MYRDLENTLLNLVNNEDKLESLTDHFSIETAVNYTDKIKFFGKDAVNLGTDKAKKYQGVEDDIYFDRKIAQILDNKGERTIVFPKIIAKQAFKKYNAYYKVAETNKGAYYQRIASKNPKPLYNTDSNILKNGYNIDEAFRPDILNIQVADNTQSIIEFESDLIKEGDIISLTNFSDPARLNKQYVIINSKAGKVLTLENIEVVPFKKIELKEIDKTETTAIPQTKESIISDEDTLQRMNQCL
jgi:hypothetical protein